MSIADNYNPQAQYDNGTCMFSNYGYDLPDDTQYTAGCMDEASVNYNPNADYDDGSCEYIGGCLNPDALNFDPSAQYDDGTCVFAG